MIRGYINEIGGYINEVGGYINGVGQQHIYKIDKLINSNALVLYIQIYFVVNSLSLKRRD